MQIYIDYYRRPNGNFNIYDFNIIFVAYHSFIFFIIIKSVLPEKCAIFVAYA